ncbi:hypothetical protein [Maribacter sp. HTCC2170]|uniref:hypothetical protein n=1 Tax=Maribacter sp. (strain HTCC2170 / KCCM 42371) TaxID=313603 RepID=UPI00006AFD0E|nr:hypothetical protein [Maribacter sp. HTCC2170]EAR01224.1 hypothetical protein FB2170_10906 [Maribacter sp. HTCC2170]
MQITTVLLVILAAIAAMGIVLFQYFYKQKSKGKLRWALSFLRFVSLFAIFLLLINPKFVKKDFSITKSNLIFLVDNSSSIGAKDGDIVVDSILKVVKNATELSNKFNIEEYKFGREVSAINDLTFGESTTDIANALSTINSIFRSSENLVVLLTDGNNTLGHDYEYFGKQHKFPVYPVVLGDTTQYEDLKITQVNINKYAFLKNKFPIEIFVSYEGEEDIDTRLNIAVGKKNVHSQKLGLSKGNNSKSIVVHLSESTVGLKSVKVSLEPLQVEKNIHNNVKNVSIEVIDEKTNVAIVSEISHPDIGALKKSIESNEQRSVTIIKPTTKINELNEIDLIILYQPTASFKNILEYVQNTKIGNFIISGPRTDWNFLNTAQKAYTKDSYNQTEEVTPLLNKAFSKFDISNYIFDIHPPLETNLGEVIINKNHEVLLNQKIKGVDIGEPLLVVSENNLEREAILFGENLWKWRVQNFREHKNFNDFDELMSKLVFYLSVNESKSRLVLSYDSFYEGNTEAKIRADYFDESFTFDAGAEISLRLQPQGEGQTQEFPMLLKGSYYETDLSSMPPGQYSFTAKVVNENISKSGSFSILDFDVEQQFTSSNYKKLDRLAVGTGGGLFFPNQISNLIDELMSEDKYVPIQKSHENVVSLVDFKFLLALIIAAFTIEWFIRKYNGLT